MYIYINICINMYMYLYVYLNCTYTYIKREAGALRETERQIERDKKRERTLREKT